MSNEVPDYTAIVGLRKTNIADIARALYENKKRREALEAEAKELREQGAKLLIKADVKVVIADGLRCTRRDSFSSRLDKDKLVKAHGTKVLKWLEDATVKTPNTTFIVKAADEDEE